MKTKKVLNELEKFIHSRQWRKIPFKVIDTEPDIGKHTFICSCLECIKIKKIVFGNFSEQEKIKYKDTLLEKILQNDGLWT